ncbi:hypothetical protein [Vibrio sp. HN007]|uniref:hypothetical protein n=1 Tax=Vibrio iocasae TaxID=3098914 RepID=UPI0035D4F773
MKFKTLPIIFALASGHGIAHASNLSYTYAELGGGLGKLTVETAGRSYDFKSKGFGGTFSYQLSPDYYVSLSHQMATVDEIDSSRGVALNLMAI